VFNYQKIPLQCILMAASASLTASASTTVKAMEKDYHDNPLFRNFIICLKTPKTKKLYSHFLDKYYLSRPENRSLSLDEIVKKDPRTIKHEIMGIVDEMRSVLNLSYASVNLFIVAITHFFEINDVVINKKKIQRTKGDNISKFEYKSYTTDEIAKILSICDDRGKAAILLMASTGMRVGALPGLKLKHLKKYDIRNASSYCVYQITVYANSPNDRYTTFCTPEAAKAIDEYLDLRKRYGDNLDDGNSYLFIKNFNKMYSVSYVARTNLIDKRPITASAIHAYIVDRLIESGLRTIHSFSTASNNNRFSQASLHKNELHPCHSLRIFAITNMQRSKVDKTIREMLVGHSTGLDKSYYKPQDDEILQEYLKAVDNLTINNENRLNQQIQKVPNERDEIKTMEEKHKEELKKMKDEMENKFQQLLTKIDLQKLNS
jgi:integrase